MAVYTVDPFDAQMPFTLDLRNVKPSLTERNSIPSNSRTQGLLCYTVAEGVLWMLAGGTSNSDWKQIYPITSTNFANVSWSLNAPGDVGNNGDLWFRDNSGTGNIDLHFKQGGVWGLLGSWSKNGGGGPSYTPDPSLPSGAGFLAYLRTNYASANPGDVVYREGTTQLIKCTCYYVDANPALNKWSKIIETIE